MLLSTSRCRQRQAHLLWLLIPEADHPDPDPAASGDHASGEASTETPSVHTCSSHSVLYRIIRLGVCVKESESQSCLTLRPHGLHIPWNSPDQNTLHQGIFPTQGSNPGVSHCRQILYQLSHKGRPVVGRSAKMQIPEPQPWKFLIQ